MESAENLSQEVKEPADTEKKADGLGLNPEQELFCKLYATDREFFGNGVQAYVEAYNFDTTKKNWYNTARACASQLLTNINVLKRIDQLFEAGGLNDQYVDKQLEKLITQDADFKTKLGAIKEFNELRGRILKKLDITTNGKDIQTNSALDELAEKLNNAIKEQYEAQPAGTGVPDVKKDDTVVEGEQDKK